MPNNRVHHIPKGDPCNKCGSPAFVHKVNHAPRFGDDCNCGAAIENHKKPKEGYIVGVDGEGQGRTDHLYTLLAYSDETGKHADHIEAAPGKRLTTVECLDFLLSIPNMARSFGFALSYDLTKILTDVDDQTLYRLMRPELRQRRGKGQKLGPKPVDWNGYRLNLIASKFVIEKGKRRRVLWDVFRFYNTRFTKALEEWKAAPPERIKEIERMKDQRGDFDKQTAEAVRTYCYDECRYLSGLVSKLIAAHNEAGLQLRSYFGCGSTAGAMLKKMGIDLLKRETPDAIKRQVAMAFAGGRFENAWAGIVPDSPIFSWDLSSAYPYQIFQLPELDTGKWEYVQHRKDIDGPHVAMALVHYELGHYFGDAAWGPFPFRTSNGSIAFPIESGGGWVWDKEYRAAERIWSHVKFAGAWVYKTTSDHKPFADIAHYYRERLRIGKEGAGIVYKNGCNSNYGKLAQSLGDAPPFQCWIWAGMITSGTRAQLLDVLAKHKDPWNCRMMATDGIQTTEELEPMPTPIDTGTAGLYADSKGKMVSKPLGGWEKKTITTGMFYARPGIYFPLQVNESQIESMRARGLGRKALYQNHQKVIDAWNNNERLENGDLGVVVGKVTRFYGAKTCISRSADENGKPVFTRSERYGQWGERPIEMSFNPLPKRDNILSDGRLTVRRFPRDQESAPYSKTTVSPEARALMRALQEMLEQPTGDEILDDYTE